MYSVNIGPENGLLPDSTKPSPQPINIDLSNVPYFHSFISKSWLNDLDDICQGLKVKGHFAWHILSCEGSFVPHMAYKNLSKFDIYCLTWVLFVSMMFDKQKLEWLERLRSEDTPRRLMITHAIESYWIPSRKKTKSKLQI